MAAMEADDITPLLAEEGGVRLRASTGEEQRKARRRKEDLGATDVTETGKGFKRQVIPPDPWWVTILEVRDDTCTKQRYKYGWLSLF